MSSPLRSGRPDPRAVRFTLLQIAGLTATNHLATRLAPRVLPGMAGSRIPDDLQRFGEAAVSDLALAVLTLAILTGVIEELIFRGLVFTLIERFAGSRWAVLGSAAAFGAAHLDPHLALIAGLVGLQLGVLRRVSGLGLPIAAHIANNLIVLLLRHADETGSALSAVSNLIPPSLALLGASGLSALSWAALAQRWRSS